MEKIISSEEDMIDFGTELAKDFKGEDIVLLHGDLGAGKTTITKGIAKGLGIDNTIVSPTFSIMNIYHVSTKAPKHNSTQKINTLMHIDTYRLEHEDDLIEIGVEDYLGRPDTITIIEWPEKIEDLLKDKKVINITIEHVDGGRNIDIQNS